MERNFFSPIRVKGFILLFLLAVFLFVFYRRTSEPVNGGDGLNGPEIAQWDPRLVAKLKNDYLIPPSNLSLNLSEPDVFDTSMGQAQVVRRLLKYKRNGFFVECGALDGETRSNTLYLERYLGWSGLLVEGDPSNFNLMVHKRRKAWISPACFSVKSHPTVVSFRQNFNLGQISEYPAGYSQPGYVDVQCFPLYTFLLALNRTEVDYLSLDVEGSELEVLQTVPWGGVKIKVLSVEFIHGPRGREYLQEFMESQGYRVVETVVHANNLANDFIFVKN